jgi:hypothetical protein
MVRAFLAFKTMLVPEVPVQLLLAVLVMRSLVVRPVAQAVVTLLLVPEDRLFMVAQAVVVAAVQIPQPVTVVPEGLLTLTVLVAARRGGLVRVATVQMALLEPMAVELEAVEEAQPPLVQQAVAELVETLEVAVAEVATVAVLVQLVEPEAMAALVQ